MTLTALSLQSRCMVPSTIHKCPPMATKESLSVLALFRCMESQFSILGLHWRKLLLPEQLPSLYLALSRVKSTIGKQVTRLLLQAQSSIQEIMILPVLTKLKSSRSQLNQIQSSRSVVLLPISIMEPQVQVINTPGIILQIVVHSQDQRWETIHK